MLGDTVSATAILGRLLHPTYVRTISGENVACGEKKRTGFIGVGSASLKSFPEDAMARNQLEVGHPNRRRISHVYADVHSGGRQLWAGQLSACSSPRQHLR